MSRSRRARSPGCEEDRLAALEDRIDADLALGRHAALIGELEALVREHPLRERLQAQLMLALYRSGRQAEALDALSAGAAQADRRARDRARAGAAGSASGRSSPRTPNWTVPRRRMPSAAGVASGRSAARARGRVAARCGRGRDGEAARWSRGLGGVGERVLGLGGSDLAGARALDRQAFRSGGNPSSVAVSGGAVWALNADDQTVTRIDLVQPRGAHVRHRRHPGRRWPPATGRCGSSTRPAVRAPTPYPGAPTAVPGTDVGVTA